MSRAMLHIVNGYSAAGSLAEALGAEQKILVQHDVLSCGPMPRASSVEEWRSVREQYWEPLPDDFTPDPGRDLMRNADALRAAEGFCFWMASGLSDQLLFPSTVHLLRLLGLEARNSSTIQFSRLAGSAYEAVGLGELSPERLKDHPEAQHIDEAGIAEAEKAWRAVTAAEPDELLDHLRGKRAALPLLKRALGVLLQRYPDERSGLNRIDLDLLKHSEMYGPRTALVIGHTLASNGDRLDPVGDQYLMDRIERLADPELPHPALELAGDRRSLRDCTVRITPAGEAILRGAKNFVELNGIDDWVGGVHLDSKAGRVWLRRDDELVRA